MSYNDMFNLSGKVAIVTGAAGILGAEFCRALSEFGAQVIAIDCNELVLNNLLEIPKIVVERCDLSQRSQIKETIAQLIERFGKIDILLNNAAAKTADVSDFFTDDLDYTEEAWHEVMSVNLEGAFWMLQGVGRAMIKQRSGVILQTASIYGVLAADQRIYEGSQYLGQQISDPAVYSASKAALIGLTKHFAARWAKFGVRINSLCPGGVSSGQNQVFEQRYSDRVPMGRMASSQDMVGAVIYLVSKASNYVTGQTLMVDGGLGIW